MYMLLPFVGLSSILEKLLPIKQKSQFKESHELYNINIVLNTTPKKLTRISHTVVTKLANIPGLKFIFS